MAQNKHHFSMEDAHRLAQTEAGQKLMAMLKANNSPQLQSAMQQASGGNYDQLKKVLGSFLETPETRALLQQLENNHHE